MNKDEMKAEIDRLTEALKESEIEKGTLKQEITRLNQVVDAAEMHKGTLQRAIISTFIKESGI